MDQRQSDQQQEPRRREQYGDVPPGMRGEGNEPGSGENRVMNQSEGGGWSGYVVPYRYYGPGYRGVGYYAVLYEGSEPGGSSDEGRSGQGQGQGWNQGQGQAFEQGQSWSQGQPYGQQRDQGQRRQSQFGQGQSQYGRGQGQFGNSSGQGQYGQGQGQFGGSSGGFAGRGPKNYQRSDERLREEVSDRLMADDGIDASDIEVQVRGGEVTLTGTVRDRWAKRDAEDVAESVMGVKDVMNQIRVTTEREGGDAATGSPRKTSQTGATGQKSTSTGEDRSYQDATAPNGRRTTASGR